MVKLNISNKGKAWKLELEGNALNGKSVGDKIDGKDINADLTGYELEITGGSDNAGFAMSKDIEGIGLKRILLTKGWGMHKRPRREGKKRVPQTGGLRLKKTYRGRVISESTSLVNINILKEGAKKLEDIFPEQSGKVEETSSKEVKSDDVKVEEPKAEAPAEAKPEAEAPKAEEKKEEPKVEEKKEEAPKVEENKEGPKEETPQNKEEK